MLPGLELRDPGFAILFLVPPALLAASLWRRRRRSRDAAIRYSNLGPFRGLPPTARLRLRHLVPVLRAAGLGLLVVALLRPQKGSELAPETAQGVSILMAVDRSGSMETPDFQLGSKKVSRLEAVKKVFRDFVKGGDGLAGRPNDEIGIVTFAGYAVPAAPLTLDHGAVLALLDTIKVFQVPRDRFGRPVGDPEVLREETSTAIGDGLALAVERMKDLPAKSKVIILLSDGESNSGVVQPREGADLAKTYGIRIYSIGIGQSGTVLEEVDGIFGRQLVPRQSELDEDTLREVAETTGGKYFNAASVTALRDVYAEIDRMERSKIESTRFYRFDERFQWAAVPALALLVLEALLSCTVFRRIP
jgi:Ca-activated chloride channel family protein